MLSYFITYLCCGAVIGFFAGLFGIGGGIIGIPALLFLFDRQGMPVSLAMHMAIGTLFATIIITSIVSIYAHFRHGMVVISLLKKVVWGTIFGCAIGIAISSHIQGLYLEKIFGLFLLLISIQMGFDFQFQSQRQFPKNRWVFLSTTIIGMISGLLGLGGGILMVPYLSHCGVPIRHAIATAAACILPAAIVGTIGYVLSGSAVNQTTMYHSGFVYWPAFFGIVLTSVLFAPLGVKATQRISTSHLKKFFAFFVFLIGCSMTFFS